MIVSQPALFVVSIAILAFAIWCALLVVSQARHEAGGSWVTTLLITVSLIVFIVKLDVIDRFVLDLPYWDEWEFAGFHRDLENGSLAWQSLLQPHGEHPIFTTRLEALALIVANGQWDNRVLVAINAIIHAIASGVLLASIRFEGKLDLLILSGATLFLFGLPFARENVVWGYQAHFYWHIYFSQVALILVSMHRPWSVRWLTGMGAACLATMSLGAGILTPVGLVIAAVISCAAGRADRSQHLWTVLVASVITLVALSQTSGATEATSYHANNAGAFALALARSAAYPFINQPWMAIFAWLPLASLLTMAVRRRWRTDAPLDLSRDWLVVLGGWVLLHVVAIAYARGGDGVAPATRYMDILGLGIIANLIACLRIRTSFPGQAVVSVAITVWGIVMMVGAVLLINQLWTVELPAFAAVRRHQVENVRHFVESDDIGYLVDKPPLHIPYPDAGMLADLLRWPSVRSILAPSVRQPLRLSPSSPCSPDEWRALPSRFSSRASPDTVISSWAEVAHPARTCRVLVMGGTLPFISLQFARGERTSLDAVNIVQMGTSPIRAPLETMSAGRWNEYAFKRVAETPELIVADTLDADWVALARPIELGALSYWVTWLVDKRWLLGIVGILVSVAQVAVSRAARTLLVRR